LLALNCTQAALEILACCLDGRPCPPQRLGELVRAAGSEDLELAQQGTRALFQILAEGLADPFEPRLCDCYAEMFCRVISSVLPELEADSLLARYGRLRRPRVFAGGSEQARRVLVLSRVTLGADIAVTSLVLDAAKRRFPEAEIVLAGGGKSQGLFVADGRVGRLPIPYSRSGILRERLALWPALRDEARRPGTIMIDPDSRLTQLGLLPLGPEENCFFFESRAYGGESKESLTMLTRRWLAETFGVSDARAYVATSGPADLGGRPLIAVSFGVGENPAKRIPDPFETELLQTLARHHALVLVDRGAGGEEAARVDRAIAATGLGPDRVRAWEGPFADFAAIIAASRLYVGYDSAGQHAAAACGTPLVSVFAGFASPRMFDRWRPTGPGPIEVVRVDVPEPREVLDRTLAAVERLRVL